MPVPLALVRRPGPELENGLVTHQERVPVNIELAMHQWSSYVETLQGAGWAISEIEPAEDCPDAVFVEDGPFLPDWLQVMKTPGHTPHHLSYVLKGRNAGAIVTGDIIAGRNAYMNGKVNFIEIYTNYQSAQLSVMSLKGVAEEWPDTIICPSHEGPFHAADGVAVAERPFEIA